MNLILVAFFKVITVKVSRVGNENRTSFSCSSQDDVRVLTNKIRGHFGVVEAHEILIYKHVPTPGNKSIPLNHDELVADLETTDLIYHIRGTHPDLSKS